MITYVNTVLVSNKNGNSLATSADLEGVTSKQDLANLVGKFVFMNCDPAKQDGSKITDIYALNPDVDTFKIGVVTKDYFTKFDKTAGKTKYIPVVKWSNEIKAADIKSISKLTYQEDSEDKIEIDFNTISDAEKDLMANGGIAIVLRLSYKDMPTRYRQWTESYDYYTKLGDTPETIAAAFADIITKQAKRARVFAEVSGTKLTLTAMEYDDDLADDTENPTAKVRFNVAAYYMNPQAAGWASNNKYDLGATISKVPGVTYPASAKLVREHERNARGYMGAIHTCSWYDPKPALVASIDNKYGGITLEFENTYRAADDIFRKTKQTVEIYASNNGAEMDPATIGGTLLATLTSIVAARQNIVNPVDNSVAYTAATYEG